MNILRNIYHVFPDDDAVTEKPLLLGKREKKPISHAKLIWDWIYLVLMALGIFVRQGIDVAHLSLNSHGYTWVSFAISLVIAVAVYPCITIYHGAMKWALKRSAPGGPLAIAVPFSLGFFLNLLTT